MAVNIDCERFRMSQFKFEIEEQVETVEAGECGTIIGRAEYNFSEPGYLVRYRAGDGCQLTEWLSESAIGKTTGETTLKINSVRRRFESAQFGTAICQSQQLNPERSDFTKIGWFAAIVFCLVGMCTIPIAMQFVLQHSPAWLTAGNSGEPIVLSFAILFVAFIIGFFVCLKSYFESK